MDEQRHPVHEQHQHGADCGHEAVPHDNHTDYMHDGHQHFSHSGHWDEHGPTDSSGMPRSESLGGPEGGRGL